MRAEAIVTTVKGERILVSDVVAHLKLKGLFRTAIYEIIERRVIEIKAQELGLEMSQDAIGRRIEEKRSLAGLKEPGAFAAFLEFHGITAEQWYGESRVAVLRDRLKERLVTPKQVSHYYRHESARFVSVSIARIACRRREEAEQALGEARAGERDFVELARRFSIDQNTRFSGGFLGNVKRGMLPAEVERPAFAAGENDVIGPFPENALWTIYKVYAVNAPELTDALKSHIRDQIFDEWLRRQVCTVPA